MQVEELWVVEVPLLLFEDSLHGLQNMGGGEGWLLVAVLHW